MLQDIKMKICSKCGIEKELELFSLKKGRAGGGARRAKNVIVFEDVSTPKNIQTNVENQPINGISGTRNNTENGRGDIKKKIQIVSVSGWRLTQKRPKYPTSAVTTKNYLLHLVGYVATLAVLSAGL
jgi:hypothetical protein